MPLRSSSSESSPCLRRNSAINRSEAVTTASHKKDPDLASPPGVAIFCTLVFLCLFFNRAKRGLLDYVSARYRPVIHAFFEELSVLGFVSFLAFLFEKEWDEDDSLIVIIGEWIAPGYGGVLHTTLSHLHYMLFGISMSFVLVCTLLLAMSAAHFGKCMRWSSQIETHMDPRSQPCTGKIGPSISWIRPWSVAEEREIFLRLFVRFVDPRDALAGETAIPKDFNLGEYWTIVSATTIARVVTVSPGLWLTIIALGVVAWAVHYRELQAYGGSGQDDHSGNSTTLLYGVFWTFEGLLLISAIAFHFWIHSIMTSLIPLDLESPAPMMTEETATEEVEKSVRDADNWGKPAPPSGPSPAWPAALSPAHLELSSGPDWDVIAQAPSVGHTAVPVACQTAGVELGTPPQSNSRDWMSNPTRGSASLKEAEGRDRGLDGRVGKGAHSSSEACSAAAAAVGADRARLGPCPAETISRRSLFHLRPLPSAHAMLPLPASRAGLAREGRGMDSEEVKGLPLSSFGRPKAPTSLDSSPKVPTSLDGSFLFSLPHPLPRFHQPHISLS